MPFSVFCPSRRVLIAAALLLVLFMSFLLLIPEVVRRVMVYQLNERLVHPVRIGDVDSNPFTGNARAENLVIANTGSPSPLEQLASLDVGISYWGPATRESLLRSVPIRVKEQYLLERIQVTDENLRKLAHERARVIERALVQRGVTVERLFVVSKDERAVTDTLPGRTEFKVLY
jgi:hypothetical protein